MAVKCAGIPQGGGGTRRAIHVHSGAKEGLGLGDAGPGHSSHKGRPCVGLWSPAAGAGGAPALRDMTMHPLKDPLNWAQALQRGFESFDDLTAADTKLIFFPL